MSSLSFLTNSAGSCATINQLSFSSLLFVCVLIAVIACSCASVEAAEKAAPALQTFSTIQSDEIGRKLQESMIWTNPPLNDAGVAVAFRKTFELPTVPTGAELSIFADARYILWINGEYVDRGPSRFQPNGPQYDVLKVGPHLRARRNVVALLVIGNLSGGKVMRHPPGLTAMLQVDGQELFRTDSSWKWSDQTRFRKITATWADLRDTAVDARVETGDWTKESFDDATWKPAGDMKGDAWGPLTRTLIPRLHEQEVPFTFSGNVNLPRSLKPGEKLEFDTTRIVQAYPIIEFDADADSELAIEPFGVKYIARAGRQSHFTIDTKGISRGAIVLKSGRATITSFKLIERLYPFERIGSFQSNDQNLNRLWEMCARSCEILSEDSWVDCADRERVEWMDDTPPAYDIARIAMAGRDSDGKLVYSDPRLLGALIRRTALTLQPDGWVKAHTCSDRYDIHAKMEDRACDWVEGQRLYFEATGDKSILRETWPAIVAQMDYFLQRRTARGLVRARDWVVWGNPVGYLVGEGTTLNVFVQRALADAAFLGRQIEMTADADKFAAAADALSVAINTVLWDEQTGGYFAGYFEDADIAENLASKHKLTIPLTDHLAASTLHANAFALDRGLVPNSRRDRVVSAMLKQELAYTNDAIMIHYYTVKQKYALDQPELDQQILDLFRNKWSAMANAPWQCSWEGFKGGSKAHIYGMYPGYFLSSYVLGVRRDEPVAARKIVIEPHLADLTFVEGVVVTEFGPVQVAWKRDGGRLQFTCVVPDQTTATLLLPQVDKQTTAIIDGKTISPEAQGKRMLIQLTPGKHVGSY